MWMKLWVMSILMRGWESHFRFYPSRTESFWAPIKPLKVGHSDMAFRPRFRNGSDALSTPSSTPITPSSWPPRPASTRLGQTCVAGHVGSFIAWVSSPPLKPHVVTPVVMSSWPSWVVLKAREGSKMNLKWKCLHFETQCLYFETKCQCFETKCQYFEKLCKSPVDPLWKRL